MVRKQLCLILYESSESVNDKVTFLYENIQVLVPSTTDIQKSAVVTFLYLNIKVLVQCKGVNTPECRLKVVVTLHFILILCLSVTLCTL